jgi:hypothetical protein
MNTVITFHAEVDLVWVCVPTAASLSMGLISDSQYKQWTWSKVLFFWNRYGTFVILLFDTIGELLMIKYELSTNIPLDSRIGWGTQQRRTFLCRVTSFWR